MPGSQSLNLRRARNTVNCKDHSPISSVHTFRGLDTGSLNVDIGINNTDGVRAIEVINGYLAKMPALCPLILFVKGFLAQRNLNDASKAGLGSYAVTLMCIHFLQVFSLNLVDLLTRSLVFDR
jgi:DNA polymerase sigma